MDMYGFYTGRIFDAYEYLGCHVTEKGSVFRVFAPAALKVSAIGDFNNWADPQPAAQWHKCNVPPGGSPATGNRCLLSVLCKLFPQFFLA